MAGPRPKGFQNEAPPGAGLRREVDLDDIPKEVRESMAFVSVDELSEVLYHALGKRLITRSALRSGEREQRRPPSTPLRAS
jgi:hypothetical protein